jgi:hypothetical protein
LSQYSLQENGKQETGNRKPVIASPGAPIFHFPFSVSCFRFSILFIESGGAAQTPFVTPAEDRGGACIRRRLTVHGSGDA